MAKEYSVNTPVKVRGHFRRIRGCLRWIETYYRRRPNQK